jgi:hypothetical protein
MLKKNSIKIRVIACGALANEIIDICRINKLSHIDLQCLPAILHNHPHKIAPLVLKEIKKARSLGFEKIFIGYGECGTQGALDEICHDTGVERIIGPHCYAFFTGISQFLAQTEIEISAFYLTDFLARQFQAFVIDPLKLDIHPELIDIFFGNYTKLVYLAQTNDENLQKQARTAAQFLKLDYEYRFTAYGDLESSLKNL